MRTGLGIGVLVMAVPVIAMSTACERAPQDVVVPTAPTALTPHPLAIEDTLPAAEARHLPPEAYMRSYLTLFGGLAPRSVEMLAKGADGNDVFDTWGTYLSVLGFPDYRVDFPRATQTNALMLAAFARLGAALCDRALEHDWKASPRPARDKRLIFAFDPGGDDRFHEGFDVLHRTFLGYPAALAPTDREPSFHALFDDVVKRHAAPGAEATRLTPEEAGWATVCGALVRHPELLVY